MAFFEKHRTIVVVILIALIVAGAATLLYRRAVVPGAAGIVISAPMEILVHIDGAVARPGLYSLKPDSRVADAVDAAGGLNSDADYGSANFAARLQDGDQVHLYRTGESPQRININTADAWLLEALPGIGPKLAGDIIEYRAANGPFPAVEDLTRVEGVGARLLEQIRDKITVR